MKKFLLSVLLLAITIPSFSQIYTQKDKEIFNNYVNSFKEKSEIQFNRLITETALFFEGTPYVAYTLEKEPEQLVVNLSQLDCTTFVETVLALANTIRSKSHTFETFCDYLQKIRYRNGIIEDYSSRLHYTSEWASNNQKKGFLDNITHDAGGVINNFQLSIISSNPDKYKQLRNNPSLTEKIKEREEKISSHTHYYIPRKKIEKFGNHFQDGDVLGFATSIKGLDITHMAFIYKEPAQNSQEQRLTFIHASSGKEKVVVEELTLEEYALKTQKNKGIIVLRPL